MSFSRIRVSKDTTQRLKTLKGRTGLTPNILCRFALCSSLQEPGIPDSLLNDEEGQEFNRFTLTGEWDVVYTALVREWCASAGLDPDKDFVSMYRAHLNRGVSCIYGRLRGIGDLVAVLPVESATRSSSESG